MVIEELVKTVLSELKEIVKTETVVGEPLQISGVTIVPVSKISVGFGVGGGKGQSKEGVGEATGGGASIEPVAFFVVRGEKVELITVQKNEAGWGKMIELVPQIIDKVKDMKEKRDRKRAKEGKGK
ncbi:sporulation protein [bacterium]|nr:sporulation protein [bacterium]